MRDCVVKYAGIKGSILATRLSSVKLYGFIAGGRLVARRPCPHDKSVPNTERRTAMIPPDVVPGEADHINQPTI